MVLLKLSQNASRKPSLQLREINPSQGERPEAAPPHPAGAPPRQRARSRRRSAGWQGLHGRPARPPIPPSSSFRTGQTPQRRRHRTAHRRGHLRATAIAAALRGGGSARDRRDFHPSVRSRTQPRRGRLGGGAAAAVAQAAAGRRERDSAGRDTHLPPGTRPLPSLRPLGPRLSVNHGGARAPPSLSEASIAIMWSATSEWAVQVRGAPVPLGLP